MFGNYLFDTVYVNDNIGRTIARRLSVRIRYRLATGSINKAWDDVLAIYRLAEQHRETVWCFAPVMLNNAILGVADRSAEAVVIHSDWASDEIRRRSEAIMPFQRPFSEDEIRLVFRNERLMALDFIQFIANEGLNRALHCCPPGRQHDQVVENWFEKRAARLARVGLAMVEANQMFDNAEHRFFNNLPEPKGDGFSNYELFELFVWRGISGGAGIIMGRLLSGFPFFCMQHQRDSFTSRQANAALTHLVFALEAYHRDKGNYPEALDNLLGHYIDEMPLDPFSGMPFRYIIEPEGYLLYSVGPNGIDEEGRGSGDIPRGDDIRRRMP